MIERSLSGHKVVFYDNVEDLPIVQFHRYGRCLLVESGIGDTIEDIDRHIKSIAGFMNDAKKATRELLNLRQCLYVVATEQDIKTKTTLCLVRSVDGKQWEDFSDSGLELLYEMLNGASVKEMNEVASKVRNAIDENLLLYFPSVFEDSTQKNLTDLLRKRAVLQIASIAKGEDNSEAIAKIDQSIARSKSPKNFEGSESEEIKFDKQFEDMCLVMAKEFGGGVKKYSTMEFYSAFERLVKQNNEAKKLRNK